MVRRLDRRGHLHKARPPCRVPDLLNQRHEELGVRVSHVGKQVVVDDGATGAAGKPGEENGRVLPRWQVPAAEGDGQPRVVEDQAVLVGSRSTRRRDVPCENVERVEGKFVGEQ